VTSPLTLSPKLEGRQDSRQTMKLVVSIIKSGQGILANAEISNPELGHVSMVICNALEAIHRASPLDELWPIFIEIHKGSLIPRDPDT